MSDKNLPDTTQSPRSRDQYLDDVDTHIFELSWHDKNDILINRQHLVLFLEDATDGRFMLSNTSSPITTEKEL